MRITHMRVNHLTNPVGYRLGVPCFSWITEDALGKKQQAARLVAALDEAMTQTVYDSGRDETADSAAYAADFPLKPVTRYYWRVEVWTDAGEHAASPVAYFETAKQDEPWRGQWIAADFDKDIHPVLHKTVNLTGEVRQARAYAAGLGIFELEINGQKAGDEYLLPGFHSYCYWLQYMTFDITALLRGGDNTIAARLGNGWYKGRIGFEGEHSRNHEVYGDRMCFLCEIRVDYADGRTEYFGTDESWRSHPSETTFSSIYDGEFIDARLAENPEQRGVTAYEPPHIGALSARISPPIVITDRLTPSLLVTPQNEYVLDFGQIMTGWVQFDAELPRGTEIFLQYGEILQDGCFYNDNLRTAKAEFKYISDGKRRTVRPRFTFYGFRYVKVAGWPGNPDASAFTGCVIMSALERGGTIETSDPRVNQLIENIVWGQKGNFLDVPTDCPQRDERLGWTGDAQIFAGTGCFNLYSAAFYHKYLVDMRYEQPYYGGSIPYFVPSLKRPDDDLAHARYGSAAWADAATVVPWTLYLHYGDKTMLAEHYPLMKDYVDCLIARDQADGDRKLLLTGFHFADWLALDNFIEKDGCLGETDMHYVASAYYAHSTRLLSKAAKALGYDTDAARYGEHADAVAEAFRQEFFTETGRCAINTQTAYAVALCMELLPEAFVKRTADALLARIKRRGMHLETGFVGTPYLMRVLSAHGMNEAAYTLLFNDDYPSWLYEVKMGATTVWERWNSVLPDGKLSGIGMNSLNHYAYGSVGEWLYRDVCGLNPLEDAPGFKKVVIAPNPDPRLPKAALTLMTAHGLYKTAWQYADNGEWLLHITIPFDCEAQVILPSGFTEARLQGEPVEKAFTLCTGEYAVSCK